MWKKRRDIRGDSKNYKSKEKQSLDLSKRKRNTKRYTTVNFTLHRKPTIQDYDQTSQMWGRIELLWKLNRK